MMMSTALERADPSGFVRAVACGSVSVVSGDGLGDRGGIMFPDSCSPSSSSSIGRNSDEDVRSLDGEDCEEDEAQSAYKGPLDMMECLEEVLPVRKGISKFYNGKSKSFTSLCDASSASSIKFIAKPDNAYTRRQRSLMVFNHFWDKNRNIPLKGNGKRISKKPISPSKSSLALAMAISSSDLSSGCTSEDSCSSTNSRSFAHLPPLHPQTHGSLGNFARSSPPQRSFSAWRSYSVADLPECITGENANSKI